MSCRPERHQTSGALLLAQRPGAHPTSTDSSEQQQLRAARRRLRRSSSPRLRFGSGPLSNRACGAPAHRLADIVHQVACAIALRTASEAVDAESSEPSVVEPGDPVPATEPVLRGREQRDPFGRRSANVHERRTSSEPISALRPNRPVSTSHGRASAIRRVTPAQPVHTLRPGARGELP